MVHTEGLLVPVSVLDSFHYLWHFPISNSDPSTPKGKEKSGGVSSGGTTGQHLGQSEWLEVWGCPGEGSEKGLKLGLITSIEM